MKKLLFVFGFLFALTASAANLKIGVVDFQQVMQSSKQMQTETTKLKNQFAPEQAKIKAKQADLKALMDKMKRNGAVMKASDKQKMQDQISQGQQEMYGMMQQYQQEATTAQQTAMQNMQKAVNKVLPGIAAKNNLDMILVRDAVAYIKPGMDYTQQVITALA